MRLFLAHKTRWSGNNILHITNEDGSRKYDLDTSILITKTIRILDADKQEVARVKQEWKSLMPKYSVYLGDEKIMEVKKIFHPLLAKYELHGYRDWELVNKPMLHEHDIVWDGKPVASVSATRTGSKKALAIDIENPRDELAVVAAIVAIDYGIEGES